MKRILIHLIFCFFLLGSAYSQVRSGQTIQSGKTMEQANENFTFPLSDAVTRLKVTFKSLYGITLTGDLYLPKNTNRDPLPALAISGPFGAVKEQSSGLYANIMA